MRLWGHGYCLISAQQESASYSPIISGGKTFQIRSRLLREAFEGGADIFGGSGVEAALPDVFCQALENFGKWERIF